MSILFRTCLGAKVGAMCYGSITVPYVAGRKGRGWGEDSIYFDHASECRDPEHHRGCVGRWRGSVSLLHAEQPADRVERGGDVHVGVGVHTARDGTRLYDGHCHPFLWLRG